jgi:hypothetical protein
LPESFANERQVRQLSGGSRGSEGGLRDLSAETRIWRAVPEFEGQGNELTGKASRVEQVCGTREEILITERRSRELAVDPAARRGGSSIQEQIPKIEG